MVLRLMENEPDYDFTTSFNTPLVSRLAGQGGGGALTQASGGCSAQAASAG